MSSHGKNMPEINEKTTFNLRLGVISSIIISVIIFATTAGAVYNEHKDLPEKVRKLEKRSIQECYALKNLQDHLIKKEERYYIKCGEVE